MNPKVSLIASSIRESLYDGFFNSLEDEDIEIEVVFAGHTPPKKKWKNLTYIETGRIKPSQCYEIARQHSTGELIHWTADDAEYKGKILTRAYDYWKKQKNEKLILSLQTREFYLGGGDGFCDMSLHSFHGGSPNTPLMAPLALLSREYLQKIGGFDRRFICGQYENLTVCQAYVDGGTVEVFGDRESYIEIDHIEKSKKCGESKDIKDFYNRPFALGYKHDRRILESAVTVNGKNIKINSFEPYDADKEIIKKSQSHMGVWE